MEYSGCSRDDFDRLLGLKSKPPALQAVHEYVRALRAYTEATMEEFGEYGGVSKKQVHHMENHILPDEACIASWRKHLPLPPNIRDKVTNHLTRMVEEVRLHKASGKMLNRLPSERWREALVNANTDHHLAITTQGDYLRAYRNMHGLKPKDVAEAVGRSVQNVTGTENGHPEQRAYEVLAAHYESLRLSPAFDRARFEALERSPSAWTQRAGGHDKTSGHAAGH
jgi:DNA-binding XRE family transcriptional regulator